MEQVILKLAGLLGDIAEATANGEPTMYADIWLDAWWTAMEKTVEETSE